MILSELGGEAPNRTFDKERSGSRCGPSGVGTQIRIASASTARPKSVVA